jgi:formyl-CoA transferase
LSKREVAEQLIEIGYSMGMVQNTADLDQCPHLEARKMFVDCGDTLGGSFRTANTPINLTACPDTPTGPPPLLGQHNRDILCSIGGLTEEQLLGMETDRVV